MTTKGAVPLQGPLAAATEHGMLAFVIESFLKGLAGPTLVQVIRCTNTGGIVPAGFVDVQPLLNQLDGNGQATPHGEVVNLPYFRLQSGKNAVIIDPQPGDIGLACFCSRDISNVKATKAQANPASLRFFDWSDGLYLGGVLNGTATTYALFANNGDLSLVSPTQITLQAPNVKIDASEQLSVESPLASFSDRMTVATDAIVGGISSVQHVHSGVDRGGGDTDPPVP